MRFVVHGHCCQSFPGLLLLEFTLSFCYDLGFAFSICGFGFFENTHQVFTLFAAVSKWKGALCLMFQHTELTILPDLLNTAIVCPISAAILDEVMTIGLPGPLVSELKLCKAEPQIGCRWKIEVVVTAGRFRDLAVYIE